MQRVGEVECVDSGFSIIVPRATDGAASVSFSAAPLSEDDAQSQPCYSPLSRSSQSCHYDGMSSISEIAASRPVPSIVRPRHMKRHQSLPMAEGRTRNGHKCYSLSQVKNELNRSSSSETATSSSTAFPPPQVMNRCRSDPSTRRAEPPPQYLAQEETDVLEAAINSLSLVSPQEQHQLRIGGFSGSQVIRKAPAPILVSSKPGLPPRHCMSPLSIRSPIFGEGGAAGPSRIPPSPSGASASMVSPKLHASGAPSPRRAMSVSGNGRDPHSPVCFHDTAGAGGRMPGRRRKLSLQIPASNGATAGSDGRCEGRQRGDAASPAISPLSDELQMTPQSVLREGEAEQEIRLVRRTSMPCVRANQGMTGSGSERSDAASSAAMDRIEQQARALLSPGFEPTADAPPPPSVLRRVSSTNTLTDAQPPMGPGHSMPAGSGAPMASPLSMQQKKSALKSSRSASMSLLPSPRHVSFDDRVEVRVIESGHRKEGPRKAVFACP